MVESDEVTHSSSLSADVKNKILKLHDSRNILQNDNGMSKEEHEFQHCMKTTSGVMPPPLKSEGGEGLAGKAAKEDVVSHHVVEGAGALYVRL